MATILCTPPFWTNFRKCSCNKTMHCPHLLHLSLQHFSEPESTQFPVEINSVCPKMGDIKNSEFKWNKINHWTWGHQRIRLYFQTNPNTGWICLPNVCMLGWSRDFGHLITQAALHRKHVVWPIPHRNVVCKARPGTFEFCFLRERRKSNLKIKKSQTKWRAQRLNGVSHHHPVIHPHETAQSNWVF